MPIGDFMVALFCRVGWPDRPSALARGRTTKSRLLANRAFYLDARRCRGNNL